MGQKEKVIAQRDGSEAKRHLGIVLQPPVFEEQGAQSNHRQENGEGCSRPRGGFVIHQLTLRSSGSWFKILRRIHARGEWMAPPCKAIHRASFHATSTSAKMRRLRTRTFCARSNCRRAAAAFSSNKAGRKSSGNGVSHASAAA